MLTFVWGASVALSLASVAGCALLDSLAFFGEQPSAGDRQHTLVYTLGVMAMCLLSLASAARLHLPSTLLWIFVIGLGIRKYSLPEAHTDYIFSVIGEEFGLLVCGLIVVIYLAIVVRVLIRLVEEENLFTILSAAGLVSLIGGQAFINILVNLQLFPSKGMTLPLVSYGGSSTIALCLTVGLMLALTRRNPYLSRDGFDWLALLPKPEREKAARSKRTKT